MGSGGAPRFGGVPVRGVRSNSIGGVAVSAGGWGQPRFGVET